MIPGNFAPITWRAMSIAMLLAVAACGNEPPVGSAVSEQLSTVDFSAPVQEGAAVTTEELGEPDVASQDGKQIFLGKDQVVASSRGAIPYGEADGGAEINFDNAEIAEVVKVVLGDVLGVSYSIDPTVVGTVTIDSGGPLDDRQLISVLESVLGMNGALMIANGAGYKIVPDGQAQGPAGLVNLGGSTDEVAPGFGATIIPLNYISASTAAQFVRPLVHRPEDIQIDDRLNLLLVVGSTAERTNVVATLADLDVDWMAGKSVGIFPLAVTTPEAMIPELQAIFGGGESLDEFSPATTVEFIPMARLNAILAITGQPEQIVEVDKWISRLDRGKSVGLQFYVYQLKHLPAADVAQLLTESFGGIPSSLNRPAPRGGANRPVEPISYERDQFGLREQQFDTQADVALDVAPLNAQQAVDEGAAVAAVSAIQGDVKIVANKTNNSLLIRASPQAYEAIEATLRRLDRAPLQVLIEATIVEVTLNDQLKYGVQYYINEGSFQVGFDNSNAAAAAASSLINPLTSLPGFNFLFTPGSSALLIDALSSLTDVRVLSSPTLVVQDNSSATLTVGDDVPITTRTAIGVQNADAPVVNNIEYRATGVTLRVTPRINSNQVVSLDVIQEVSRLSDPTDPGLTPIITQRRIDSSVNVQTGQTIVLGGLIQDTESRNRNQTPLLGDIPGIGALFGGTNNTAVRTELLVMIKPRIIRSAEDARDVSEELRARMRSFSPVRSKSRFQPWQHMDDDETTDPASDALDQSFDQSQPPASINSSAVMPRPSADHGGPTPQAPSQQPAQTLEDPLIRQPQLASADELAGRPVPAVLNSGDPAFQPVSPVMRPIAGDTPEPMMRPL